MKTLVALDGSPDSFNALRASCRLALKTGAYVTAFYVNKSEAYTAEDTGWTSIQEKIRKELEAKGQEVIRAATAIGREHGLQIEGIMAYGVPAEQIANYCAARGIVNLVALGHSSKRRGTQGFVGSTTRMVISGVERASFLVTGSATDISSILIAVNGLDVDQRTVATAGRLAQALGAEVRLLSVYPDTEALLEEYRRIAEVPNVERHLQESAETLRRRSSEAIERSAQILSQLGVRASASVKEGSASHWILSESQSVDLTVVGLNSSQPQAKIGAVVGKLLDQPEVSLLCVQ